MLARAQQAPASPPAPRPSLQAMAGAPAETPRAIRRDVPMTNAIRRAFEAGTRDWSGRPGPNYWQLENDYTIQVRLDPATHTLTGSETITLHNNSPQELQEIMLRLDHNMYRGLVPRAAPWTPAENTDGCVITRLMVNGEAVNLSAPPADGRGGGRGRGGAGGGAAAPRQLSVSGLQTTLATINLATPIAAKSNATLTIDWHTQLPGGPDGRNHRMTQRFEDRLFQPTQWFPRVAKYDDLRGWDTNLYLGPSEFYNNFGRFDVRIDVPAGWIVSGTGVLQNPNEVLTPVQRERLSHVLESDNITTISSAEEVGPGQADGGGRSSGVASRRPTGSTTSRGPRRASSCGRPRARRFPARARCRSTWCSSRITPTSTRTPDQSRGTRSSSTPSCGRRIRFRSSPCRTDRAPGWNTRW